VCDNVEGFSNLLLAFPLLGIENLWFAGNIWFIVWRQVKHFGELLTSNF